jgi:hypothetical protein
MSSVPELASALIDVPEPEALKAHPPFPLDAGKFKALFAAYFAANQDLETNVTTWGSEEEGTGSIQISCEVPRPRSVSVSRISSKTPIPPTSHPFSAMREGLHIKGPYVRWGDDAKGTERGPIPADELATLRQMVEGKDDIHVGEIKEGPDDVMSLVLYRLRKV